MNETTTAIEDLRRELKSRSFAQTTVESTVVLTINIIALAGNTLVCCIFYKSPRLRTTTNTYILALAVSDVSMATFCIPLVVGVLITGEWKYPSPICSVHGFSVLFFSFLSLQILSLTALNRYFRIAKPWAFKRSLTKRFALFSVLTAAGIAVVLVGFPLVIGWGELKYHPGKITCVLDLQGRAKDLAYSSLLGLLLVVVPFAIIGFCYSKVYQKVQKHRRKFSATVRTQRNEPTATEQTNSSRLSVEEINITITLFAIVLAFTCCWIPVIAIEFVDSLRGNFSLPRPIYLLYVCLVALSAAINPIIYGIMNKTFKMEYYKIFQLRRRVKKPPKFRREKNGKFDSTL